MNMNISENNCTTYDFRLSKRLELGMFLVGLIDFPSATERREVN